MVRLMGVDLPKNKEISYSLTYIYGIGIKSAQKIVKLANINVRKKLIELTLDELAFLRKIIEESNLKIEGNLRKFNTLNISHLVEINCYRGKRHKQNLPVRGQRTRTNASTRRNKKK